MPAPESWRRQPGSHSRQTRPATVAAWLCALVLVLPLPLAAATLAVGAPVPPLTLNDQHDKPVSIAADTRWIVFASEKSVSDMVSP